MGEPMLRMEATHGRRLRRAIVFDGRGLHGGEPCRLRLVPVRQPGWWLAASTGWVRIAEASLQSTDHRTELVVAGRRYATIEHVLSALSGLRIDGVGIDLSGGEAPALDGSAAPLVGPLLGASVPVDDASVWVVARPLEVDDGTSLIRVEPGDSRTLSVEVDFPLPEGAPLTSSWTDAGDYAQRVATARTFAFTSWLETLAAAGLARGGSIDNALVLDDQGRALNPGGLRCADEVARHKLLDLVGDLARLGAPLVARVFAHRPGHGINARLVDALCART